jgi:hypothetical protein
LIIERASSPRHQSADCRSDAKTGNHAAWQSLVIVHLLSLGSIAEITVLGFNLAAFMANRSPWSTFATRCTFTGHRKVSHED